MEWVILGLIVAVLLWGVAIYNRLVALRQTVGQSWADIEVQLKQRHDLIPNLVETVKGYAAHEGATLEAVIRARNMAVGAHTPDAASAAEGQLSGALSRLFALSEAYPDLKANTNFQQLQGELSATETKIAAARCAAGILGHLASDLLELLAVGDERAGRADLCAFQLLSLFVRVGRQAQCAGVRSAAAAALAAARSRRASGRR
jgi:LemA protein